MKRFLIVDDDEMSCEVLELFMTEYAACDIAPNGRIGYELFEKAIIDGHPYDLVCSDVDMPELDGHKMVGLIRAKEESLSIAGYTPIRVFMISASGSPMDMSQAILENNCDDYIVKPFQRESLKVMLQKYDLLENVNEP